MAIVIVLSVLWFFILVWTGSMVRHGRHSNDVCFSCQALGDHEIDNYGNPFLTQVVGFNLAGQTITVQDLLDAEKDKR